VNCQPEDNLSKSLVRKTRLLGRNCPITERDRFRICRHSGIIAKATRRTTSRFGDVTYTEVSSESWLEYRSQPSDRGENSNDFATVSETRRPKHSQ
jgi:hypothetical protein